MNTIQLLQAFLFDLKHNDHISRYYKQLFVLQLWELRLYHILIMLHSRLQTECQIS